MEIRILGPVQVWAGPRRLPLEGPRTEALLAALAAEAGRMVPVETLIESAWERDPPATVRRQVRNRLTALRRSLRAAGLPGEAIRAERDGFLLDPSRVLIDAVEFHRLAALPDAASLRRAFGLWRGPALAGCESPRLHALAARLAEQRLAVSERFADLELRLGRHRAVLGELGRLHAGHPASEPITARLMLAHYRSGDPVRAANAYAATVRHLADHLGVGPGARLRSLHERIARHDPELLLPMRGDPDTRAASFVAEVLP